MNKREYLTTVWWKSAIKFQGPYLVLSNGKNADSLKIRLPRNFDMSEIEFIKTIEFVYKHGQYALHFTYVTEKEVADAGDAVLGIDIGEIHPMVTHDGVETTIFNGRYTRSLYQLRNKVIASFNAKIDRCQKNSKRYWYLVKRKWRKLRSIQNQINDGLHKHTTRLVERCSQRGVGTVVVGDLTDIRDGMNYSRRANQKLHQWSFNKLAFMLEYKCKDAGIAVEYVDEAYTSQTCPACGKRHKPRNRNYECVCGFKYHRDGVGAINIRNKYLGCLGVPVEATMVSPFGIRLDTKCYAT